MLFPFFVSKKTELLAIMKRFLQLVLIFFLSTYLIAIGMLFFLQKKIIFQPKQLHKNYTYTFETPYQEFYLKGKDNANINALFFKSTQINPKGIILYFHGNADNLQRWGKYHIDFTSRGYDFFAIDYHGYGKSDGEVGEQAMYSDAQLAYNWAIQRYPKERIIIYGRSLGSGAASHLAAQEDARMLVLETPFNNIAGAFNDRPYTPTMPFEFKYRFPNDKNIQKVKYPIYIFHGTNDWVVPYQSAQKLKPFLKKEDIFFTIQGGKHKNLNTFAAYHQHLDHIL